MKLRIPQKGTTWIVIIMCMVAVFSVISPSLDPEKPKEKMPDFSFEDVTISQIDEGKLTWEIHAQYATLDKKDQNQLVTLHQADGLFMVQERPIRFNSDELDWVSETQQFMGKGHVIIKSPPITLSGDYFSLQIPIRKIRLEHNSRASIEGHP